MKTLLLIVGGITALLVVTTASVILIKPTSLQPELPVVLQPESRPTSAPTASPIPDTKLLASDYHVFQTFNNCGPAALSMALSYYGISVSQQVLGEALRPYQVPGGDNDDKSVTLEELAEKSKEYGLIPYHRPNGRLTIIKQFVALDIPVITRTWLRVGEDIGHYRLIKGYDETAGTFLQDDSLQGKNLTYTYADFNELWQAFNYEYLVLVPADKKALAEQILGTEIDAATAWRNALATAEAELTIDPNNMYTQFNVSVAHYHLGNYQQSVQAFETVENRLPFRMLWYQIEPILAYQKLGDSDRIFAITDKILNNHNRAYSELYQIRGEIYLTQGNREAARGEFEKALVYNKYFKPAHVALTQL